MKRRSTYRFRLFVAGHAHNSECAIANLNALCREYLPGRHQIEVVDVFRHPDRAMADGVFMTPTLVQLGPGPEHRIIGTLSDTRVVVQALALQRVAG